jgi:hypothetical protein
MPDTETITEETEKPVFLGYYKPHRLKKNQLTATIPKDACNELGIVASDEGGLLGCWLDKENEMLIYKVAKKEEPTL